MRTKKEKALVEKAMDHYVFAACPGCFSCERSKRAIVCRIYPFEPHLDRQGRIVGLAYQRERDKNCPLTSRSPGIIKRAYIANSIKFWREMFELFPEERELYQRESRKRVRRAKRSEQRIPVFLETGSTISVK